MSKSKSKPKPAPEAIEKIGKVSNESVLKGSKKTWAQWVAILERAGARAWSHREIVAFLADKYKLEPWWQQGVTYGFELYTRRRIEGQNLKGDFTLTASRTVGLGYKAAWEFLISDEGLGIWLKPLSEIDFSPKSEFETEDGFFGEIRTMKANERARLTWIDPDWEKPSTVNLFIVPRPGAKCIVVFSHEQLKTERIKEQMRERWKDALNGIVAGAKRT